MSSGPINAWRLGHVPPTMSTTAKDRVCAPDLSTGRSVCGRRKQRTEVWSKVTCPDCHAARRAGG